jgi:hypothetical protein
MPAPADVDTVDNGQAGRPEQGDEVVFTFASAFDPTLVLAGWDGSATPVTVQIAGGSSDVLTVWNAADTAQLTELGSVDTKGDYAASATFSASQMTLGGSPERHRLPRPVGEDDGLDDAAGPGHRVGPSRLELLSSKPGSSNNRLKPITTP